MIFLAAATLVCGVTPAVELDLVYSFEDPVVPEDPVLDGFAANGAGITVTQDTIGATEGANSMKLDILELATFEAALTSNVLPTFADPPGLDFVVFDLTITEEWGDPEGFINAGITVFGSTQPDFTPSGPLEGLSAQFQDDEVPLQDLEVGTHEIRINLLNAIVNPLTFNPGESFNEIFGDLGTGPTDLIATGFNLYLNKSPTSAWTGYIDNVRVGSLTPNGGDYNGDGVVDAADYTVWRDSQPFSLRGDGTTTGDLLGVPDGIIDESDYDYWAQEFGATVTSSAAGVPEPSAVLLLATAGSLLLSRTRPPLR